MSRAAIPVSWAMILAGVVLTVGVTANGQSAVESSPWLNGVTTFSADCTNQRIFTHMFNGRGGWLVIPVYEWVTWGDGHCGEAALQYDLRPRVEQAANNGFCVILRLYWKQNGAAGPQDSPTGAWCIPPEGATEWRDDFADWCRLVVNKLGGGDLGLPAVCSHYIIGNEPNQKGEHGGSECFDPAWYAEVFLACQAQMRDLVPTSKVIVAGVTPGETGCMSGEAWTEYISAIASELGTQADRFAIHNNGDILPDADENTPPHIWQAFATGQFEEYINAIVAGRGTYEGLRYYVDETNPFLHPDQGVKYPESWLVHTFDAMAKWNDDQLLSYGYRPIQCVCYYSYFFPGWSNFNLAGSSSGCISNWTLDLWKAAIYDFPILIHRNDQPRPDLNLLGTAGAHSNPDEAGRACDGKPDTYWNGGNPWIGIWFNSDRGLQRYKRLLAWQYQGAAGPAESTACAYPNGIVRNQCFQESFDGVLHVWRDYDLMPYPGHRFDLMYLTTNNDYYAEKCNDVTETNMGWIEVEVFPRPEDVSEKGPVSITTPPWVEPVGGKQGTRSVIVHWSTDVASSSRVDYGPTSAYGSFVYDPTPVTDHAMLITDLDDRVGYHFTVTSGGPGYTPALSDGQAYDVRAVAWASLKTHGGPAPSKSGCKQDEMVLPIILDPAASGSGVVIEPREYGVQRIRVDFNTDVTDLMAGGFQAEDLTHGGTVAAEAYEVINDGTSIVIDFFWNLSNQTCYRIDLAGHINGLTGDTDCMVRALTGDINGGGPPYGDGRVNLTDMAKAKSNALNYLPLDESTCQFDVNLDGSIDLTDMAMIKDLSLAGGSANCPGR